MHSSWSFTTGVALLRTCSASAMVPRRDDVPKNCSLVPQVFYPKVINTCCDKATTITVDECQTEIVLPAPGCIDTTISQTVTKTDDHHGKKTESRSRTWAPATSTVAPTASPTVVYKHDYGGYGGRWKNRQKPWEGLTVYNPVFEGKNIDSDGNGDYRGNKSEYEDKSWTSKTDNSREWNLDQSGDYRDNQPKYAGGEGNGDGSQYNTGDYSGNNRDKTDNSRDYRNNQLKYEDHSEDTKTDVDVDLNRFGNKNSGNYNPVDNSDNSDDSDNSNYEANSDYEYDYNWSPTTDNSRAYYDDLNHNRVEDSNNDDHSRVDVDVRLQDFLKNNGDYRDNVMKWYSQHNTEIWACNVGGDSSIPGFFSIVLDLCIQLPIGLSVDVGDVITTGTGGILEITQAIYDQVLQELADAGLDQYGLPYLPIPGNNAPYYTRA